MKRVNVFCNGKCTDGKVVLAGNSLEHLLQEAGRKLDLPEAEKLYTANGGLIDDINLIRDDDVLYVCQTESFIPLSPHRQRGPSCVTCTSSTHAGEKSDTDWITLNVGGRYFTTTRSTLTTKEPSGMLARMFAGDNADLVWHSSVDSSGAFLIDRSPRYFEPILNYLRHGELVLDKDANPQGVLEEARFFGIVSLVERLEVVVKERQPPDDLAPITRREFVLRLLATPSNCELRCQGINFAGADLSKLDLRYMNFKYAVLREANLTGANLSYCTFERADMSGAKLDTANLLGVKMLCVNLEHASLQGCNFEDPAGSRANLEGANMKFVNLEGSHMAAINLRVATLKNANLQNCDLRGAVLAGADLMNCDLSGCDLQEANLRGFRLAMVQMAVGNVKKTNLERATSLVVEAAKQGANMVILPECCNSPFGNEYFADYAESIPGESTEAYSQAAKDNNVFLVAGSIPEKKNGKLYNTTTVFNPEGSLVARFSKMHLFDVDIPGGITFMESKTLTPGNAFATFDTPYCKVGLGICFDIRFPEFSKLYVDQGCELLVFPSAFSMTTGPAHWELLTRARASDNQLYVAMVSPARDETATYVAWGYSSLADPWGQIIGKAGHEETIVYGDIDLDFVKKVRGQMPLMKQRRQDIYRVTDLSKN